MSEYPKFQRIVIDVEIEVLDEITAKTFTFDTTAEGGIGLEGETPDWHLSRIVGQLLATELTQRSDQTGIRLVGAGQLPRPTTPEGWYSKFELPETPGRNDDGSMIIPPSWEGMFEE